MIHNSPPRLGLLPGLIFSSRWLQLPLYLGLIVAQGVYVMLFLKELWHLLTHATSFGEMEIMLLVLGLTVYGVGVGYDRRRLLRFLSAVKSGAPEVRAPVYSHHTYDIVPGAEVVASAVASAACAPASFRRPNPGR